MSKLSKEDHKKLFKTFEEEYRKLRIVMAILQDEELSFTVRSHDKYCTIPVQMIEVQDNGTSLHLRSVIVPDQDLTTEIIQIRQGDEILWTNDFQYHIPKNKVFTISYDYRVNRPDDWRKDVK